MHWKRGLMYIMIHKFRLLFFLPNYFTVKQQFYTKYFVLSHFISVVFTLSYMNFPQECHCSLSQINIHKLNIWIIYARHYEVVCQVTIAPNCKPPHYTDSLEWLNSKVHGANMGPIWGRQDPGGPHVGAMNFAIWVIYLVAQIKAISVYCELSYQPWDKTLYV